jgi:hypothetical protein
VTLVASDSSGLGFPPDSMIVMWFRRSSSATSGSSPGAPAASPEETYRAQVFLSDPAPQAG